MIICRRLFQQVVFVCLLTPSISQQDNPLFKIPERVLIGSHWIEHAMQCLLPEAVNLFLYDSFQWSYVFFSRVLLFSVSASKTRLEIQSVECQCD